jgi:hypothetical protein
MARARSGWIERNPAVYPSKTPLPEIATAETVLYESHPAMFRNHPVGFVLCLLLAPVGVGLLILAAWYLQVIGTTLTVTDRRISLRKGVLSRDLNEVYLADIRNVRISQSLFQRLFGTGYVGVSSAAQSGIELEVNGLPAPYNVKRIIDQYR